MAGRVFNVGILALQGSFAEHEQRLISSRANPVLVKDIESLAAVDALIIPGGESTAIENLLTSSNLFFPLIERIKSNMPVWGTCAGAVLMARSIEGQTASLGVMDIFVRRNAYGRQHNSFMANEMIKGVGKFDMVFVRAPMITQVGDEVTVLSKVNGSIVAARQKNMLVTTFHPELTDDNRMHKYFLSMVK